MVKQNKRGRDQVERAVGEPSTGKVLRRVSAQPLSPTDNFVRRSGSGNLKSPSTAAGNRARSSSQPVHDPVYGTPLQHTQYRTIDPRRRIVTDDGDEEEDEEPLALGGQEGRDESPNPTPKQLAKDTQRTLPSNGGKDTGTVTYDACIVDEAKRVLFHKIVHDQIWGRRNLVLSKVDILDDARAVLEKYNIFDEPSKVAVGKSNFLNSLYHALSQWRSDCAKPIRAGIDSIYAVEVPVGQPNRQSLQSWLETWRQNWKLQRDLCRIYRGIHKVRGISIASLVDTRQVIPQVAPEHRHLVKEGDLDTLKVYYKVPIGLVKLVAYTLQCRARYVHVNNIAEEEKKVIERSVEFDYEPCKKPVLRVWKEELDWAREYGRIPDPKYTVDLDDFDAREIKDDGEDSDFEVVPDRAAPNCEAQEDDE